MKMRIEVDCTPQEARAFLGLPDVEPLNKAMLAQVEEQIAKNAALLDPETMARAWFPMTNPGVEAMQKFMDAALKTRGTRSDSADSSKS